MIKYLTINNFTVFKQAELKFSSGLNVIIGENGTGKSNLLKLSYMLSNAWVDIENLSPESAKVYFSERLKNLFKPEKIGNLTAFDSDGNSLVGCIYYPPENQSSNLDDQFWRISFSNSADENVTDALYFTRSGNFGKSVFIPSKEIISWFKGFIALDKKREISFDETYKDLAINLELSKIKKISPSLNNALEFLLVDVGGSLELDGGQFFLVSKDSKRTEANLMAEGFRKLAGLLRLIENGSLEVGDTLYWDEPESNLNPKLIKDLAKMLHFLCKAGIQVIIATHSYFLLKELDILSRSKNGNIETNYIGLTKTDNGVHVEQGARFQSLSSLVALDEELAQYDREQSLYYQNKGD